MCYWGPPEAAAIPMLFGDMARRGPRLRQPRKFMFFASAGAQMAAMPWQRVGTAAQFDELYLSARRRRLWGRVSLLAFSSPIGRRRLHTARWSRRASVSPADVRDSLADEGVVQNDVPPRGGALVSVTALEARQSHSRARDTVNVHRERESSFVLRNPQGCPQGCAPGSAVATVRSDLLQGFFSSAAVA